MYREGAAPGGSRIKQSGAPTSATSAASQSAQLQLIDFAMFPASWRLQCCSLLLVSVILLLLMSCCSCKDAWERPGCHKVGHTRKISIPDCVEFHITTNACRGYCESWAVPSALDTLRVNPHQAITSVGQCCNIMDTEDVEVRVMCLDGTRDLVFKSAKSCSCYHCKKD